MTSSLLSKNIKIKIYKTIILSVVLYGCKTWSLTLREERRLRVFESRVLRGVFVPKRDGVTGVWGKLNKEELNDLYSAPNFFGWSYRKEGMGRACSTYRGQERCRQDFGWETWGKRPLGRPRPTCEDNIKMYLQVLGCRGMNWIDLAQNRDSWQELVNSVMKFRVP